jgi:hypothetical protein
MSTANFDAFTSILRKQQEISNENRYKTEFKAISFRLSALYEVLLNLEPQKLTPERKRILFNIYYGVTKELDAYLTKLPLCETHHYLQTQVYILQHEFSS